MAGLILVKSNAEIDRQEMAAAEAERQAEERRQDQVESNLAAHIRRAWEVAKRHKEPVERRMLDILNRLASRYSDDKKQEILDQGLPLIYMRITSVKCRAAKSWIRDVLMPAGDRPYSIKPTPMPSLPPEMEQRVHQRVMQDAVQYMQITGQMLTDEAIEQVEDEFRRKVKQAIEGKAEAACERMADLIQDQLVEGGWDRQFDDVISDLVDFPAAIMKGPVVRRRKKLAWDGGQMSVHSTLAPEAERVNPFNFYPAPGIVDPDEGDVFEVHDYTPKDLYDLIGLPGYNEEALRDAIADYEGGLVDSDRTALRSAQFRNRGDNATSHHEERTIEAKEYWGSVVGRKLIEWGMTEDEIPDADDSYDIMAVLIGRHVVCVRLNPDPLGRKPYSKACFENVPGAFWGQCVPELIADCQDVCNATARALVANMGIASGPQVVVNTSSIPAGEDVTNVYPWKIWQLDFAKTGANSKPPIDFYQPSPMVNDLLRVYEHHSRLADEYSGIPSYTYGGQQHQGGAARTASGLSMLMNAASKAIKNVIKHMDSGILTPLIEQFYCYNMLWHDDPSIKADAQVVARGAVSLIAKEQNQIRVQELLMQTANPVDMQIIGMDGRAALLRRAVQGVDVGADDVVPSKEELKMQTQLASMQQQQQPVQNLDPAGNPVGQQVAM